MNSLKVFFIKNIGMSSLYFKRKSSTDNINSHLHVTAKILYLKQSLKEGICSSFLWLYIYFCLLCTIEILRRQLMHRFYDVSGKPKNVGDFSMNLPRF